MYKKMPAGSLAELTDEEFKNFSDLIYRLSGIYLKDSKITLLSNRLRQRIAERKFGSFAEYYDYIRKGEDEGEINQMLNAVSTNETYFFRSDKHFDALRDRIMPELMKKIFRPIRIWCAGCSSGEEPYTIAMIMNEKNWLS
ncbi:MAG: chemotaxis protein CheR, partial [Spirochaetales bacterium]|nr:chemotaxis protein CheR [Spirochaetales bacterium]